MDAVIAGETIGTLKGPRMMIPVTSASEPLMTKANLASSSMASISMMKSPGFVEGDFRNQDTERAGAKSMAAAQLKKEASK